MNSLEVLTEVFNASNNFDAFKGFVVAFACCKRNLKAELDALKKQADQDATFSEYWRAVIESAFKVVYLIIEGNAAQFIEFCTKLIIITGAASLTNFETKNF